MPERATKPNSTATEGAAESRTTKSAKARRRTPPREHGGPQGPEPTRYGDWERNGRCSDF